MDKLRNPNSEMTQWIIETSQAGQSVGFSRLAQKLGENIAERDRNDMIKIDQGIKLAVANGTISKDYKEVTPIAVVVTDKDAEQVAIEIFERIKDDIKEGGIVVTLEGLSGTGKSTTVKMLKGMLLKTQIWSNGIIFRSVTLLAKQRAEKAGLSLEDELAKPEARTAAHWEPLCDMVSVEEEGTKFEVRIQGMGLNHLASDVQHTLLKQSDIERNISNVALMLQGEVFKILQDAVKKMTAKGFNVLIEGREQPLNRMGTKHRFELVLEDGSIIGKRQAALKVGAKANEILKKLIAGEEEDNRLSDEDAEEALWVALGRVMEEEGMRDDAAQEESNQEDDA